MQSEAAECGLACLAMIAGYYRHHIDMFEFRRKFGLSSQGANLKNIMEIAASLNMRSRAVRLEINELHQLKTPCVLHWDLCHFVVLVKVSRHRVVIHDPALGKRKLNMMQVSQHFTGVALELWPAVDFSCQKVTQQFGLKSILNHVSGFKRFLMKILSLSLLIEGVNLLLPVGTQLVMDHVIIARDQSLLALICLGLLAFIVFRTLLSMCRSWLTLVTSASIDIQWCERLFDHLIHLPHSWFEKRKLGDIQSRFMSLDTIRNVLTTSIVGIVVDGIMATGVMTMMWLYGSWLMWVVFASMAVYVLMRIFTWPLYRQIAEEQIVNEAKVSSHFMETLHGMATIKALSLTRLRSMQWLTLKIDAINSGIRLSRFDMVFGGVSMLVAALDQVIILWLGAGLVIDGTLSLGMFIAFNAYRGEFSSRTVTLVNTLLQLRMLNLHSGRVADIARSEAEPTSQQGLFFENDTAMALYGRGITYRYDKLSRPVVDDLDITVSAGECVALTGASGSGKTTLMKILAGLTIPEGGNVFVNGRDIHKIGIDNYRRYIACVLQDDKLFAGTIEENIAGFDDEMDRSRVVHCAQLSCIDREIMNMPMGYQTLLSELGSSVSGGQHQRLLIARALYRQPKILFMDEATSHLDLANESRINAAIAALNITRIIIAHRPSTIASADRVIEIGSDTTR
nr:peptidase domain-containing ABC transporter [Pantoea sp. 201603H]